MTLAELPLLLMDETARAKLLAPVNNLYIRTFWNSYNRWRADRQEELTSSTRNRVGNFLRDSFVLDIIGQGETMLNFLQIMHYHKILLLRLSLPHTLIPHLTRTTIVQPLPNA